MHRKERRHKPQLRDITEQLPPPQIPAKGTQTETLTLKHQIKNDWVIKMLDNTVREGSIQLS